LENTSAVTIDNSVERLVSGIATWVEINSNWVNIQLWDIDVELGTTYDYRVRARGLAGFSDYSNIATATAPGTPVDNEDPVVSIISPFNGSTVSATVDVNVQASDNVGVTYMEIRVYSNLGDDLLRSAGDTISLDRSWNTRNLGTRLVHVKGLCRRCHEQRRI